MECIENYQLVNKLSDDLLIEILSRRPIKSLLQCKCVSKAWISLISDTRSLKKLPQAMCGLFYHVHGSEPSRCNYEIEYVSMLQSNKSGDSIEESHSFLPPCSQYRIVDCCNGLLLCDSFKGNSPTSYICNPATKRWTELTPDYHLILLALCFDLSISLHYTVLGFKVESSGDMIDENFINEIPVLFLSENPKWVEINVPWWCEMNSCIQQHVLLNGSIHFLGYTEPVALAIDLEREIYQMIELLGSKQEVVYWNACLGHSQGYLHYVQKCENQIVFWVLHDYDKNEWNLKHTIHLKALIENQEVIDAQSSSNTDNLIENQEVIDAQSSSSTSARLIFLGISSGL